VNGQLTHIPKKVAKAVKVLVENGAKTKKEAKGATMKVEKAQKMIVEKVSKVEKAAKGVADKVGKAQKEVKAGAEKVGMIGSQICRGIRYYRKRNQEKNC
jgi:predicted HAD superfamily phosphohydrolase YqeG